MTKDIATAIGRQAERETLSTVEALRSKENPRRGLPARDAAKEFIKLYPIGTTLTWSEFSAWASRPHIGLISKPEPVAAEGEEVDRQSDAWLAHLQSRHQGRSKLNKAASHSRIGTPFVVVTESAQHQTLAVKSTAMALAEAQAAKQVASLTGTKKRQLRYLIESTDWSQLPAYERLMAESLYDAIDTFTEAVMAQGNGLQKQFNKLQQRFSILVNSGQLTSSNGGIAGMLSAQDDDEEE